IREVWRIALALVDDAFGPQAGVVERLHLFEKIDPREIGVLRQMFATGLNTISAHGAGRYFDAIGALLFSRQRASFEGQVALLLNNIAAPLDTGSYEFDLDRSGAPWLLDLRPMVRQIAEDLLSGTDHARIAACFHNTLIAGTAAMIRAAAEVHGRLPVVLTGGCFQNPRLAEGIAAALCEISPVFLNRIVPPGDGGIALGQAMIARVAAEAKG
ncbi:MAG TPA: hypothetical protein VMT58_01420, partial [Candidatus Binataceae bacterium]|nr:hypothetical protein [Candidatus Binataceae bacterium]